jgi:hypothetical protein
LTQNVSPKGQKIIAFDPGYTTGVAIQSNISDMLTLMQVKGLKPVWAVLHTGQPDMIVYEKFFYQRRDKVDLRPVEAIGIIKLYAERTTTPIIGQSAQQAKRFWTDKKIKKLGMWESGEPHAMDALRHLLYFQTFKLNDQTLLERLK